MIMDKLRQIEIPFFFFSPRLTTSDPVNLLSFIFQSHFQVRSDAHDFSHIFLQIPFNNISKWNVHVKSVNQSISSLHIWWSKTFCPGFINLFTESMSTLLEHYCCFKMLLLLVLILIIIIIIIIILLLLFKIFILKSILGINNPEGYKH